MLCNACVQAINIWTADTERSPYEAHDQLLAIVPRVRHHHSAEGFLESVRAGCFICRYLHLRNSVWRQFGDLLTRMGPDGTDDRDFTSMEYFLGLDGPHIGFIFRDFSIPGHHNLVELRHDREVEAKAQIWHTGAATRPSDKTRKQLAKTWQQNCIATHKCSRLRSASFTPSRLLQLDFTAQGGAIWRLFIAADETNTKVAQYVTVSHRWSTDDTLRLTSQKVHEMKVYHPEEILPYNLREAMKFSRALGFNYIWIDSLCIIQDSKEDWRQESLKMQDIYRNSSCNIVTAVTQNDINGSSSFLDSPLNEPEIIQLHWKIGESHLSKHKYHVMPSQRRDSVIWDSELSRRGWILQELLLSPIILYLFPDGLHWNCCHFQASEAYPNGLRGDDDSKHAMETFRQVKRTFYNRLKHPTETWLGLVEQYSRSGLTYSTDRLIAFTGVAKAIRALWATKYFAGHFRHTLPFSLLWHIDKERDIASTIKESTESYRAPSWSWASANGPVHFLWTRNIGGYAKFKFKWRDAKRMAKVKKIFTDSITGDPFGHLTCGYIILTGKLLTLHNNRKVQESINFIELDNPETENRMDGAFFLPVTLHKDFDELGCLVLMPVSDTQNPGYNRIGVAVLNTASKRVNSSSPALTKPFFPIEDLSRISSSSIRIC